MLRQAKIMILVNVLIFVLFVAFDYGEVLTINEWSKATPVSIYWSPIEISIFPQTNPPGTGSATLFNFPLILFFIAILANAYFIVKFQRSKETKPSASAV